MAESYLVRTGVLALSASATKCLASIITGSTQTARLVQAWVSLDGATAVAAPAFEIVRYTTDGTGSAFTPLKYNGEAQNRAALCTAKTNYSADPTTPTVVDDGFIPNTSGQLWQWPLGRELYIPASTVLGLRAVTAAGVTPNVRVSLVFEE